MVNSKSPPKNYNSSVASNLAPDFRDYSVHFINILIRYKYIVAIDTYAIRKMKQRLAILVSYISFK